MELLDKIERFFGMKKPPVHKLKWKLPELRFTFATNDAEKAVATVKKIAVFKSGGEFNDSILAKEYGEGVYAYFIIRSEKKTEQESLLFDGYMIQEDEPLGLNLQSAFSTTESLQKIGYNPVLTRFVTEWRFSTLNYKVNVFDIEGIGAFIEFALPQTDLEKTREIQNKAFELAVKRIGLKQKDALPTDVITLQFISTQGEKTKGKAETNFTLGQ